MKVQVLKDKEVVKEWSNQTNDFEAFKWLLNHQGNSIRHAVKYEGWNAIGTKDGKEMFNYKKEIK